MKIRTLLIDDEGKARKTLNLLLQQFCPEVDVVADFDCVADAEKFMENNQIDLIFLDIEMPGETGIQFLERLQDRQMKVIMVTAHSHYAVKAIKFEAFDYVLKPIDVAELRKSIDKFTRKSSGRQNTPAVTDQTLKLPTREGIIFIKQADIVHVDADGSYSTIYTNDTRLMVSQNLSELGRQLNPSLFLRVHNSHIINLTKVKTYIKTEGHFAEMTNGNKVAIARRKKDEFLLAIRSA